jgi:beta-phosphoglucomutase-like phosphatase (HAD superfamily)
VFLYACECVGERPEDCLAVEDSPNGIRSASSAGCRTVMVPDLTPADDELKSLIVAEVPSLSDIIGLIESGRL